ncbi:electron transport complex subunit RsxB [Trinickia soli]|uniref:Ferredoxin n=1 Tax=Trinickia soli TaxID=380675 RepID=A0A2N7W080_9BURK|nr:electron transport complex subunit RsxB [Trinickia soli]PMS22812.1 ferredoxin [Trinickia soli]CAB3684675.1 Ion-translocating oxidoreductase complex subunit B [Trinickia soli]
MTDRVTLADRIEDLLPQTQCTKCGYAGCRPYAEALAQGEASHNQCPPGGAEGVARLARLLGKPVIPLNPENGEERARPLAVIDETLCIGCTLCMQACPVDAIVGAPKLMHTVLAQLCTGCDLCVAPCPVDCIEMTPVTGERTGWDAWSQAQADAARERHARRMARLERERQAAQARAAARRAEATALASTSVCAPATAPATAPANDEAAKKRAIIQAALERARQKKEALAAQGLGPKNVTGVSAAVQAQIDAAEARRQALADPTAARGEQPESQAPRQSNAAAQPGQPAQPGEADPKHAGDQPAADRRADENP